MGADPQLARRSGVRLDVARFDYELGRRGLTGRRLAELAGLHEVVLSRARRGRPVSEQTLRRITKALLEAPLVLGADLLIAEPEKKTAAAAAVSSEAARASGAPTS